MSIRVVVEEIIVHRRDNRCGNLRAAGAVEIRNRKAIVNALQSGKMGPYLFNRSDDVSVRLFVVSGH